MSEIDLFDILRRHTIVLVDNDEWIRGAVTMFFENEGVDIVALETAEEALVEVAAHTYSIIVVDYRLTGMNGLTFFKKILNTHQKAMKIMISAYGNDALIRESKKLGVHAFIEKPFTTEIIEQTITQLINKGLLPDREG